MRRGVRSVTRIAFGCVICGATFLAASGSRADGTEPTQPKPSGRVDIRSLPRKFAREADKAVVFQQYMQTTVALATEWLSKKEIEFCQAFAKDLTALRGITFVEPIARAVSIDDPGLRAYWPRCSALRPQSWVGQVPIAGSLQSQQEKFYATKDAALYFVNITNIRPPAPTYVLFDEGICTLSQPAFCVQPWYRVISPKQCTYGEVQLPGADMFDNWSESPFRFGLSALISYSKSIWSLSVKDDGGALAFVTLDRRAATKRGSLCFFDRLDKTEPEIFRQRSSNRPPNSGNAHDAGEGQK